jgi:Flp pilus assembly pilin Flp
MTRKIVHILRDSRGVAALEYALLVGFIVIAIAGILNSTTLKTDLSTIFTNLETQLTAAANG